MNILNKFRSGLIKTSNFLTSNIILSITSKKINPEIIQDIETTLISADIGLEVTDHLISKIKATKINNHVDSTFILKGKKKVELTSELREKKYPVSVDYKPKDRWEHNNPYLKNLGVYQESENDEQTKNGYDYLLNTPTIQLSLEYKDQLDKQCVEREKELEILEKLTIEEMWIGELDAFKKEYRTFLKNYNFDPRSARQTPNEHSSNTVLTVLGVNRDASVTGAVIKLKLDDANL